MGDMAKNAEDIFLQECSETWKDPRHFTAHDELLDFTLPPRRRLKKKLTSEEAEAIFAQNPIIDI